MPKKSKSANDRETIRLAPDVRKLLQAALDETGESKSMIFNQAIRQNITAVVELLAKQKRERGANVEDAVRKIREIQRKGEGKEK